MTPQAAIQAATLNTSELIGMSKDMGTIEVEKFAEFIDVAGDPLTDIGVMEMVAFVLKGGEVVKNDQ